MKKRRASFLTEKDLINYAQKYNQKHRKVRLEAYIEPTDVGYVLHIEGYPDIEIDEKNSFLDRYCKNERLPNGTCFVVLEIVVGEDKERLSRMEAYLKLGTDILPLKNVYVDYPVNSLTLSDKGWNTLWQVYDGEKGGLNKESFFERKAVRKVVLAILEDKTELDKITYADLLWEFFKEGYAFYLTKFSEASEGERYSPWDVHEVVKVGYKDDNNLYVECYKYYPYDEDDNDSIFGYDADVDDVVRDDNLEKKDTISKDEFASYLEDFPVVENCSRAAYDDSEKEKYIQCWVKDLIEIIETDLPAFVKEKNYIDPYNYYLGYNDCSCELYTEQEVYKFVKKFLFG